MRAQRLIFRLALVAAVLLPAATPHAQAPAAAGAVVLKPTIHPPLPADLSQLWLAPSSRGPGRTAALNEFALAVKLEVDSNFAKALPIFLQPNVRQGTLGHYAEYYQGLAELRLGRAADARQTFQALAARNPAGYLVEAAALREAECDEALNDQDAAMLVYERLSKTKTTAPDDVLMRFGRMAKAAGHADKAVDAYSRLIYEFPFSDLAPLAAGELDGLPIPPIAAGSNRFKLELGRAERLFAAKRYAQARPAYEALRSVARNDDRDLVELRLGECDYLLKRARIARDGIKPFLDKGARQGEALYFYAVATRELGGHEEYFRIIRRIVAEFPNQSWAEEGAQQPRHSLHPAERRRERGEDVPRDVREVSRPAITRSAPRGRSAGGRTATGISRKPSACSKARPPTSRVRTIVRRGCTGRDARTRR